MEVVVIDASGTGLPGVEVALFVDEPPRGFPGDEVREGPWQLTDSAGRARLRSSRSGEFYAVARLEGFESGVAGPVLLDPGGRVDDGRELEIVLRNPPMDSLAAVDNEIHDSDSLSHYLIDFECHREAGSTSWRRVRFGGSGFVGAVSRVAFCPGTGEFVSLSYPQGESAPAPVRTEPRPQRSFAGKLLRAGTREFYDFPACLSPQPAIESGADLKQDLGCDWIEVTNWGVWD